MSNSRSTILSAYAQVAVAPTQTVLMSWSRDQIIGARRVTAYVYNSNASQTLVGVVQRRIVNSSVWADSALPDFSSVAPLTAVMADLDVEGSDEVRIVATASGAGLNALCGASRKGATP